MWPTSADSLVAAQHALAASAPATVPVLPDAAYVGACWVCFPRGLIGPGTDHDPAWCAAVIMRGHRVIEERVSIGMAGAPYVPGLLALRLGRLMEAAVRGLSRRPDVLLLDATARDHPRRAGLALQLGAELNLPSIGVTHRPLLAGGEWPGEQRGASSPLTIDDTVVGCWLRTRSTVRPLVVHPGWRIDLETAIAVISSTTGRQRTPEPLRRARRLARRARAGVDP